MAWPASMACVSKFSASPSDLPNSRVLCLLAARDGTLWIGTDGGGLVSLRDGGFPGADRKDGLRSDTVTDAGGGCAGPTLGRALRRG